MKTEFYWKFIAFVLTIMLPQDGSGEKVKEILFHKAKAPGNHDEVAAMFKLLKPVKYLSPDGDSTNETLMMPGKVAAKPKTKDEDYNRLFMEAIEVDNQGELIDLLIAGNCEKIANCSDKSVKTIIVATDVIHKCIGDITRALSDQGTVIVIGKDSAAVAIAVSHIYKLTDLYFYKHYDLPKRVKLATRTFDNSTSEAFIEKLHTLISNQKYQEAVDMSKHLYTTYFDHFKKTIMPKVYAQLTQKGNGDKLMNFIYKLVQNNEKGIIKDCFPLAFQWIFNGDTIRFLNKERKGTISLSDFKDGSYRWVFTKCDETKDSNRLFTLNPIWNTDSNSIVFQIQNPAFGIRLSPGYGTVANIKFRLVWACDWEGESKWHLKPGFNENGILTFCLVSTMYDAYLSQSECGSYVRVIKDTCTPDKGWIIDKP